MELLSVIEKLELIGRITNSGNLPIYINNTNEIERIELSQMNNGNYYVCITTKNHEHRNTQ